MLYISCSIKNPLDPQKICIGQLSNNYPKLLTDHVRLFGVLLSAGNDSTLSCLNGKLFPRVLVSRCDLFYQPFSPNNLFFRQRNKISIVLISYDSKKSLHRSNIKFLNSY